MTLRQGFPALVTLMVIGGGLAAVEAARLGQWGLAFVLVVFAAIADAVDGRVARWLRATGPMGAQLDSLADVVAFGAAPALLFIARYSDAPGLLRLGVALAFVGAGAFRLARFGVETKHDEFSGMPITCGGLFFAAAVAQPVAHGAAITGAVGIVLAVLMVSRVPFAKLTAWHWEFTPILAAAAIPMLLEPSAETGAAVVCALLGAYTLWSVAGPLVRDGGLMDRLRDHAPAHP
ncbi:MAG: hypothetical protein EXR68_02560 [Dehalococcoidia bacterium]|nr:hypothetical protein [Dehalococcoidia bacterium]